MWKEIETLYQVRGGEKYMIEEPITQSQHAIQTALQIKKMGGSESLQVSGLLHDIGHLIDKNIDPSENIDDKHEIKGGNWLKSRGFGPLVYNPIMMHVNAKKYMCCKDQEYISTLSKASKHTLKLQGGIMTNEEASLFEKEKYFKQAIMLRKADDLGKEISLEYLPEFNTFKELVENVQQRYRIACELVVLLSNKKLRGKRKWEKMLQIVDRLTHYNEKVSETIEKAKNNYETYKTIREKAGYFNYINDSKMFVNTIIMLNNSLLLA